MWILEWGKGPHTYDAWAPSYLPQALGETTGREITFETCNIIWMSILMHKLGKG